MTQNIVKKRLNLGVQLVVAPSIHKHTKEN